MLALNTADALSGNCLAASRETASLQPLSLMFPYSAAVGPTRPVMQMWPDIPGSGLPIQPDWGGNLCYIYIYNISAALYTEYKVS